MKKASEVDGLDAVRSDLLRLADDCIDTGVPDVGFRLHQVARRLAKFSKSSPEFLETGPFRTDYFSNDQGRKPRDAP